MQYQFKIMPQKTDPCHSWGGFSTCAFHCCTFRWGEATHASARKAHVAEQLVAGDVDDGLGAKKNAHRQLEPGIR